MKGEKNRMREESYEIGAMISKLQLDDDEVSIDLHPDGRGRDYCARREYCARIEY
jgi:hypothetical protein